MIKCEEGMSIWLICLKLPASYYYEVESVSKIIPLSSSDSTAQDVYENCTLLFFEHGNSVEKETGKFKKYMLF